MPLVDTQYSSTVSRQFAGSMVVEYLCRRFPYRSEEEWRLQVQSGNILVNRSSSPDEPTSSNSELSSPSSSPSASSSTVGSSLVVDPEWRVRRGDEVVYLVRGFEEAEVPTDVEVVWSGEGLVVARKPAGTPMTRTRRVLENTFVELLRRAASLPLLSPLHRLDAETSGLVACCAEPRSLRALCRRMEDGSLVPRKFYLAVTRLPSSWSDYSCAIPLGPVDGDPVRLRVGPLSPDNPRAKACITRLTTVASLSSHSLVLARISSGRKHQIRAHLAALGRPLIGDKLYSDEDAAPFLAIQASSSPSSVSSSESLLFPRHEVALGASHHLLHALALDLIPTPAASPLRIFCDRLDPEWQPYLEPFDGWQAQVEHLLTGPFGC